MRDLTRARDTAVDDLRSKRQQISAFLLRKGLHYCAGKKTWSQAHVNWLMSQKFEYPEHRLVFEEMMMARCARRKSGWGGSNRRSVLRCRTGHWQIWSLR